MKILIIVLLGSILMACDDGGTSATGGHVEVRIVTDNPVAVTPEAVEEETEVDE